MESSESDILSFLIDWMQDRIDTDYPKTKKATFDVTNDTVPFKAIDSLSGLEFVFEIETEFYPDDKRISQPSGMRNMTLTQLAEHIHSEINDVR